MDEKRRCATGRTKLKLIAGSEGRGVNIGRGSEKSCRVSSQITKKRER